MFPCAETGHFCESPPAGRAGWNPYAIQALFIFPGFRVKRGMLPIASVRHSWRRPGTTKPFATAIALAKAVDEVNPYNYTTCLPTSRIPCQARFVAFRILKDIPGVPVATGPGIQQVRAIVDS